MAAKKTYGPNQLPRVGTVSESLARWKRDKESIGVSWRDIPGLTLRAAIHAALSRDCALMFAPSSGGRGVMVKVYDGGQAHSEHAVDAEELVMLLNGLIEAYSSGSEDVLQSLASPSDSVAAD